MLWLFPVRLLVKISHVRDPSSSLGQRRWWREMLHREPRFRLRILLVQGLQLHLLLLQFLWQTIQVLHHPMHLLYQPHNIYQQPFNPIKIIIMPWVKECLQLLVHWVLQLLWLLWQPPSMGLLPESMVLRHLQRHQHHQQVLRRLQEETTITVTMGWIYP